MEEHRMEGEAYCVVSLCAAGARKVAPEMPSSKSSSSTASVYFPEVFANKP
jgi:hypothetical protein